MENKDPLAAVVTVYQFIDIIQEYYRQSYNRSAL